MPKKFYNFTKEDGQAELSIFDEIHPWFGVGAQEFYSALQETKGKDLDVYINSPGGSVYEGFAITNMLIAREGKTRVHILGMAASIASVIAMAADPGELHMPVNSAMFVHLPLVNSGGNEEELSKVIVDLKKIKDQLISAYQRHSTLSREELEQAMRDETLFTAEEAAESFGAIVQPMVEIAAKFDGDTLSSKALAFYDRVKTFTKSKSVENSTGDKTKTPTGKDKAMSTELEAKVSSLEAKNTELVVAQKAELESSTNSAREEVQTAEKARRDGISALHAKYNNDKGDLNEMTIKALSDGTEVSDFKDQVLDHVTTNRAGAKPQKPGAGDEGNEGERTEEVINKEITETADSVEKGKLVLELRALRKAK
jgi:ATP-dependent Clp protease protease subunit